MLLGMLWHRTSKMSLPRCWPPTQEQGFLFMDPIPTSTSSAPHQEAEGSTLILPGCIREMDKGRGRGDTGQLRDVPESTCSAGTFSLTLP